MTDAPSTSLWLLPADPDRSTFRAEIARLAAEHATPAFEPHVTLASGVVDRAAVVDAVRSVAAEVAPFPAVAGDTGHGAERFTALYVRFADERFASLAERLAGDLGLPFDRRGLDPHLSLLYRADLPGDVRADLARQCSFAGRPVVFDTLMAIRPAGAPDDVERWETVVTAPLAGRP